MELSESFYLTLMAGGFAFLGLVIKKLSASKCDEVSCFGIHIHRVVSLEKDDIESNNETKISL